MDPNDPNYAFFTGQQFSIPGRTETPPPEPEEQEEQQEESEE